MATEKISAETRTEFGKGAARRIRRDHKIPAVVYGHGNETVHVALPGHDTMMALKHGGANALLELDIEGTTQLALTKAVQIDPIRRIIEHIDFVAVRLGEKVTVDVPVHLLGHAASETLVVTENTTVQIEAEATNIPERIEISIEGLPAGTQILAGQLELPEGSTLLVDPETLIVNITEQQSEEALEAELEEAEAEAGIEREEHDADRRGAGCRGWRVRRGWRGRCRGRRLGGVTRDGSAGLWGRALDRRGARQSRSGVRRPPAQRRLPRRRRAGSPAGHAVQGPQGQPLRGGRGPAAALPRASPGRASSSIRPRCYMNEIGGPIKALLSFFKVAPGAAGRGARRAGHPVRHDAGEVRRRRQRPQRAALDPRLARHR